MSHRVAALCLGRVVAFDLGVVSEVFTESRTARGEQLYELEACAVEPGRIESTTGFAIDGLAGLEALERADTVVVPGYRRVLDPPHPAAVDALRAFFEGGGRVASVCTGAFALAYAGLLDGRRATTHWYSAARLAEMFPACTVEPNALYVDEGRVLTSAGLSAGVDLCLHIVRRDHGEAVGAATARTMVASPHRDGGQAQFIDRPLPGATGSLEPVRGWALEHLAEPLDVETLARHADVSPRTFARRFVAETGTTPLKWLNAQRVLEARRLLEATDLPVEDVAARAGFGSAPSLRQHFRRTAATTPTAYRRAFRGAGARLQH
jgi:AraC family transcriptional regulator, transcriptional activator FtrA